MIHSLRTSLLNGRFTSAGDDASRSNRLEHFLFIRMWCGILVSGPSGFHGHPSQGWSLGPIPAAYKSRGINVKGCYTDKQLYPRRHSSTRGSIRSIETSRHPQCILLSIMPEWVCRSQSISFLGVPHTPPTFQNDRYAVGGMESSLVSKAYPSRPVGRQTRSVSDSIHRWSIDTIRSCRSYQRP